MRGEGKWVASSVLYWLFRRLDAPVPMTYDVGLLIDVLGRLTQKEGRRDARQSARLGQ